ncbi:MAG: aminotransferase, partial [Aquihabitans sp.]
GLSVIFTTASLAGEFGAARGAVNLIDTHRHVFVNWEPVQQRRTYHAAANPFATAHDNVVYNADHFPRTLDVLRRTCSITLDPQLPVAAMRLQAKLLARAAAALPS